MADTNPKDLAAEVERCQGVLEEIQKKKSEAFVKASKAADSLRSLEAEEQKAYNDLTAAVDAAIAYYEAFKH